MNKPDLKPCPFCGSEAIAQQDFAGGLIMCTKCEALMRNRNGFNVDDIIPKWNERSNMGKKNWVSVKDRFPYTAGLYLVCYCYPWDSAPHIKTAHFLTDLKDNGQFEYEGISGAGFFNGDGEGDWVENNITYWMELPELPEEYRK